jgi:hypothetical protein
MKSKKKHSLRNKNNDNEKRKTKQEENYIYLRLLSARAGSKLLFFLYFFSKKTSPISLYFLIFFQTNISINQLTAYTLVLLFIIINSTTKKNVLNQQSHNINLVDFVCVRVFLMVLSL